MYIAFTGAAAVGIVGYAVVLQIDKAFPFLGDDADGLVSTKTCADNGDAAAFSEKLPALYEDFQEMANRPLTGKPVYDILIDPKNEIRSCLAPKADMDGALGLYFGRENEIAVLNPGKEGVFMHENFHAVQDMNGVLGHPNGEPVLTKTDSMALNFMNEAAAVGYSFIYYKEAEKYDSSAYRDFKRSPASYRMSLIFDRAYAQEWESSGNEQAALQAGGRAVVRGLLDKKNPDWMKAYVPIVIRNANNRRYPSGGMTPEYEEMRRDLFLKSGSVSPGINMVPEEFLTGDGDQVAAGILKKAGIVTSPR